MGWQRLSAIFLTWTWTVQKFQWWPWKDWKKGQPMMDENWGRKSWFDEGRKTEDNGVVGSCLWAVVGEYKQEEHRWCRLPTNFHIVISHCFVSKMNWCYQVSLDSLLCSSRAKTSTLPYRPSFHLFSFSPSSSFHITLIITPGQLGGETTRHTHQKHWSTSGT